MVQHSSSPNDRSSRRNLFPVEDNDENMSCCSDDDETVVILQQGDDGSGVASSSTTAPLFHDPNLIIETPNAINTRMVASTTGGDDPTINRGNNNNNNYNPMNNPSFRHLSAITTAMGPPLWISSLGVDGTIGGEVSTIDEEERLIVIREKLKESYAKSCQKFLLLCLVPTILLSIVIWSLLVDLGGCTSDDITTCRRERRVFINAYTARCICQSVLNGL